MFCFVFFPHLIPRNTRTPRVARFHTHQANKRMEAVDTILEQLCRFGLRRREPILAVGGGVLLDIVGMAAALYRRGVPFIRVPTTLLALVDASVGVKNGVDYCSCSMGPQKNRVGTFYAPVGAFLDKSFIATQVCVWNGGVYREYLGVAMGNNGGGLLA